MLDRPGGSVPAALGGLSGLRVAGASVLGGLVLVIGGLLVSSLPQGDRALVSGVGLLAAGVGAALSCGLAARGSTGRRRRAWWLLTTAALVAVTGNLVGGTAASSGGSGASVTDLGIAVALVLTIVGAMSLPEHRWRGTELGTLALDGLLAAAAVFIMASSLVYSDLLAATPAGLPERLTVLLIPVLDVLLATVASVLFIRSRGADRLVMSLIALGSVLYALADLRYAVRVAQGTFEFGGWPDLGWIAGYVLIALAAVVAASAPVQDRGRLTRPAGSRGTDTVAVFGILLAAGVVQIMAPAGDDVRTAQALLWLVMIIAACARQVILSRENVALRLGLERRVAEQTADLRRMVRQTSVLVDSVGDGIYGVDGVGAVTFMNRSGRQLLGLADLAQISGRHAHDAFHAPRPDGTRFPRSGCYVTEAIESGRLAVGEDDEYVRTDGTLLPVEITASPILDEEGATATGAVVVFRDATARREMERIKEEFLSVVSHELRTPLTSIRGSLGLLSGGALGELPPRAARVASMAEDSSERLARIIDDMLDLERLATGTVLLQTRAVPASVLLEAVLAEMSGLVDTKDVTVVVDSADGVALVDDDRFVQVMTNLVGNAMKFSAPGAVVRMAATEVDGEILVRVRDEGRGIPEDQLDRVFERFHQVDSSDSRVKGGTGLGLAISQELIERMGGRIWAESIVGIGTTFWFTVPVGVLDGSQEARPQ